MRKWLMVFLIMILSACAQEDLTPLTLTVGEEIPVPYGYTFIDAAASGTTMRMTAYCQRDDTFRIFECTGGLVGREIVLPEGYFFLGASEYGSYGQYTQYYCTRADTRRVFICLVEKKE